MFQQTVSHTDEVKIPPGVKKPRANKKHHPNNRMYTPCKKIEGEEFWKYFECYGSGDRMEYRQVWDLPGFEEKCAGIHIFWYMNHGYAIYVEYEGGKHTPHFYRIGCDHEWETTLSRMCYREFQCKKCGAKDSEDSSD